MKINYSHYQSDIFNEGQHGEGNIAISAAAGSGKTFTIVELANMLKRGSKVIFLAFNSHIKKELEKKLPSHIQAKTFHALGYAALAKQVRKVNCIDNGKKINNKCWKVIKEREKDFKWEQIKEKAGVLSDICDLVRNTLTDYKNVNSVTEMCVQYGIDIEKYDINELCELAGQIIEWGVDNFYKTGECDFVEMLYIPYRDNLDVPKFDMMLIDECQDMNPLQIALIKMIAHRGTRVVMVGDPFQAIYGFTGALSDSFHQLRDAFNAKEMPLSICYRCPISHIKIAKLYDGGRTEWAPDAIEGEVHYITQDKIVDYVKPQDLIICRLTAPLLGIAVKLIAKKVAAVVLGRNIGGQLTKYVDDVMKTGRDEDEAKWDDFVERLECHTNFMKDKVSKQRNPEFQLEMLNDKYECLMVCYQSPGFDSGSMEGFKASINALFSDKQSLVTLATVHRVKGLEANRTFVIVDKAGAEIMPLRWKGQLPWQFQQEMNIAYVAFTRAKKEMFICGSNQAVCDNYKEKFSKTIPFSVTESPRIENPISGQEEPTSHLIEPVIQTTARHPQMINTPFDQDDELFIGAPDEDDDGVPFVNPITTIKPPEQAAEEIVDQLTKPKSVKNKKSFKGIKIK